METVEERGNNGKVYKKTVIIAAKDLPPAERWSPISERNFPYELTLSFVLTSAAPGVPIPVKLEEQHRAAVPLDRPLSEETGRMLAEWARGDSVVSQADRVADLIAAGDAACADGAVSLGQWGAALTAADKKLLGLERIKAWKERVLQTEEVF